MAASVIRIATLAWLIVHFTLTLLYVMPPTPLRSAMAPVLRATIGTWFPQNWSFFAPEPVSTGLEILLRPLAGSDVASARRSRAPDDGWFNVSALGWQRFQSTRFSACDRVIRAQSSIVRDYLDGAVTLGPWADACAHGDTTACRTYERLTPVVHDEASRAIGRLGSSFCNELPAGFDAATHFAVRVRTTPVVPWSLRHRAKPVATTIELGIWPIDRTVAKSFLLGAATP